MNKPGPDNEDEVNAAFAEFLRLSESSEILDIEAFLRQFPNIRHELEPLIELHQRFRPGEVEKTVVGPVSADSNDSPTEDFSGTQYRIPRQLGDFKIIREIGRGGMGVVFEARQGNLDRTVALKILPATDDLDYRRLQRFRNEIAAAGKLDHPNIVPIYASDSKENSHFYAMKLIKGDNLARLIKMIVVRKSEPDGRHSIRHSSGPGDSGTLPTATIKEIAELGVAGDVRSQGRYFRAIAKIVAVLADALHHAHETGIVHRDIKPANLMLDETGNPWVTDFGLAQINANPNRQTRTGTLIGTLRYMSPEQAYARRVVVDHRTDIYSLGVTLYELLTLSHAITGDTEAELLRMIAFEEPSRPSRVRRTVPLDLETITLKAMSKNPDERFQSAGEFAKDLRRFLTNEPIIARRPSIGRRLQKWVIRHKTLVTTTSCVCVLLVGLGSALALEKYNSAVRIGQLEQDQRIKEEQKRKELEQSLAVSESLRLATESTLKLPQNPRESVELARRAVAANAGVESRSALWEAQSQNHELQTISVEHVVDSMDLSPDEATIVTVSSKSHYQGKKNVVAHVRDAENGKILATITSRGSIRSATFSPRGDRILTTAQIDQKTLVEVWDKSGQRLFEISGALLERTERSVFSPSGNRIAAPLADGNVVVVDCVEGQPIVTLSGHTGVVRLCHFSPGGDLLVTAADDNTVRIWNGRDGRELQKIPFWSNQSNASKCLVNSLQFSPNAKRLLTTATTFGAHVWDVQSGRQVIPDALSGDRAVFAANGQAILLDRYSKTEIRDAESGYRIAEVNGRLLGLSENEKYLATNDSNVIEIYDAVSGKLAAELKGHTSHIVSGEFSKDGRRLFSASGDKTLREWSVFNGEQRQTLPRRYPDKVILKGVGKHLLVGSVSRWQTRVIDADGNSGKPVRGRVFAKGFGKQQHVVVDGTVAQLFSSREGITARVDVGAQIDDVRFHEASGLVLLLDRPGRCWAWQSRTGDRRIITGHEQRITDIAIRNDGKEFATASVDGLVKVWSADQKPLADLTHETILTQVRYGAGRIVTCAKSGAVQTWNGETFQKEHELKCDAVTPDSLIVVNGRYLVGYGRFQSSGLCCWKIDTGDLLHTFDESMRLRSVDATPSSPNLLFTDGNDVVIWNCESGDETLRFEKATSRTRFGPSGESVFVAPKVLTFRDPMFVPFEEFRQPVGSVIERLDLNGDKLEGFATRLGRSVQLSATNSQMAISEKVYGTEVWDVTENQLVAERYAHSAPLSFCDLLNDGRELLMVSWDGTVTIQNVADGSESVTRLDSDAAILAADRLGHRLVAGCGNGKVLVWEHKAGQWQEDATWMHAESVHEVALSPEHIVSASLDGMIKTRDFGTGQIESFEFGESIRWLDISEDGRCVVFCLDGNTDRHGENGLYGMNWSGTEATGDVLAHSIRPWRLIQRIAGKGRCKAVEWISSSRIVVAAENGLWQQDLASMTSKSLLDRSLNGSSFRGHLFLAHDHESVYFIRT